MKRWLSFLGFLFFLNINSFSTDIVLPMGPLNEVIVKQVPLYQEVLWKNCTFDQMNEIYLKLTRYTVTKGYGTVKPLILELPDLNWTVTQPFHLALPLAGAQEKDWPKDPKLFLEEKESSRVVCLAFRGSYEQETFQPRLKQLQQWIADKGLVTAGNPRLLLYHYNSFRPNWWRSAEIQQPVR